ncbi:MAG TPA: hypothetical protein VFA89_08085 [Terriglobales bacterium]|nr:hypothetical protein [Terriglobales bacterium]
MAENLDGIQCPLCQGQGKIQRAEIIARLSDPDLKCKLERSREELLHEEREGELVGSGIMNHSGRDFEKEVHSWNPQLPIWRRSPKE